MYKFRSYGGERDRGRERGREGLQGLSLKHKQAYKPPYKVPTTVHSSCAFDAQSMKNDNKPKVALAAHNNGFLPISPSIAVRQKAS